MNIVLVKHPNINGLYAFKVPDGEELAPGNYVLCMTRKGNDQIGRCVTPSFEVEEDMLGDFYGASATKMKPITSLLIPFRYEDKKTEPQAGETDAEGQDN